MVVDPRRMYAYWEVRDDAIEAARKALGPGGAGAWLNLRVYDISGRIFDGTNAHSYFDVKVDRPTASGSSRSASPPRRTASRSA
jgi:hypothetical protein